MNHNDFLFFINPLTYTAGNDITVRLYDEDTKKEIASMKPYLFEQPGHSGRIFCVKYFPND